SDVLGVYRGAVVVVARIAPYDAGVRLAGEWSDYVREHIVRQPRDTVIVRFAPPDPVARNRRVTFLAAGALARVIPHREDGATRADRKVGLPLRTGSGIGVQLERRTEGHAAVCGADIIDVAGVVAGAVLSIDVVNHVVDGARLTPAHVSPVTGEYGGEVAVVAASATIAGPREVGAGVGVGPSGAAISGPEHAVGARPGSTSASFV